MELVILGNKQGRTALYNAAKDLVKEGGKKLVLVATAVEDGHVATVRLLIETGGEGLLFLFLALMAQRCTRPVMRVLCGC